MKLIQTSLNCALLLIIVIHAVAATCFPATYGTWLQTIDNARYEYTMGE